MNQEIRFCTCPDGARIAYALSGRGAPLVMSGVWLNLPANAVARVRSVIDPTTAELAVA